MLCWELLNYVWKTKSLTAVSVYLPTKPPVYDFIEHLNNVRAKLVQSGWTPRIPGGSKSEGFWSRHAAFLFLRCHVRWRCDSGWRLRSWWLCRRRRPSWLLWTPRTPSAGEGWRERRLKEVTVQQDLWEITWQMISLLQDKLRTVHVHYAVSCVMKRTHRMGVADSGDVLAGGAVLHGQSSFVDHLSCALQRNTQQRLV